MTAWTLGRLRARGESYLRELGQARVLELLGRPAPTAASIREGYDHELGQGALDVALELADHAGPRMTDARSGRLLLAWLAGLEAARKCAPLDDWISRWRSGAIVRTADGRSVPFADADRVIAGERDRTSRLRLDSARAELAKRELVPTLLERSERERDSIEAIGMGGSMLEIEARLSGDDPDALASAARDALKQSHDAWRDSFGHRLHRMASLSIDEARPSDVSAAIDTSEFDGAFRPSMRPITMRRLVAEIGLDPDAGDRLRIEPAMQRDAPDAACVAVDVPRKVHVILGAEGGFAASRESLRALGRALGLVHMQRDAPFEFRWLGDRGAGEIAGLTLGLVLLDDEWLMRYAGLGRSEAEKVVRVAALAALHEVRHECATFIWHVESIDAELPAGARQHLYVDVIRRATGVPPHESDAVLRAPPLLHPCARLRAWQAASVLANELVQRFDVDWYRNPRAGPWLAQNVFAPACGESSTEVVKGATGRDPSLGPWLSRLEQILAA